MARSKNDRAGRLYLFPKGRPPGSDPAQRSGPTLSTLTAVRLFLLLIVVAAVGYLLMPGMVFFPADLKLGEISPRTLIVPAELEIRDDRTIRERQQRAEEEVPAVYDFDQRAIERGEERITTAFEAYRRLTTDASGSNLAQRLQERERVFQNSLAISLSPRSLQTLRSAAFEPETERISRQVFHEVMGLGIAPDRAALLAEEPKGILIRIVGEKKESYQRDLRSILDLREAEKAVRDRTVAAFGGPNDRVQLVTEIVTRLLTPNLTFNRSETESRKLEAVAALSPLFYRVRKGDVIIRAGERVSEAHLPVLQAIQRHQRGMAVAQAVSGLTMIIVMLLAMFTLDLHRYRATLLRDIGKLGLLATLLVGTLALTRFSQFLLRAFLDKFPQIDPSAINFAIPVAVGAMLASLFFDVHISLIFATVASLLIGVMFPEEPLFILYAFVGGVVAAFAVSRCRRRNDLLKAGLLVGLANFVMVVAIDLFLDRLGGFKGLYDLGFALGGGLMVALVGSAVVPVLESLFSITTDVRLLELLDLNQPLLRQLLLTAPGTYHHSMLVSSLAESAAEAIGENALLARVSCYYHDIGKMLKPEYYVENQPTSFNRHDRLSPSMSALVLSAHVKEGVDLARRHKLPPAIIEIIPQHHGTRLIKYFYEKAVRNHDPSLPPVNEEDFRYPGPRPQSKIAAIVMLADGVEAASRVLSDPTPARISNLVDKIMTGIFLDGQLDGTDLTLKDLHKIKESFTKGLTGIFHHRIEYPGMPLGAYAPSDEHLDRKPTEKTESRPAETEIAGRKDPGESRPY